MPKTSIPHDLLHNKKVSTQDAISIAKARKALEEQIDAEAFGEARAMRRINAFRPQRGKKYAKPGQGAKKK